MDETTSELLAIMQARDKKISALFQEASYQIAGMARSLSELGDTLNDIYITMYPHVVAGDEEE